MGECLMKIFLVRHGIAGERDPNATEEEDSRRELTSKGRKELHGIGEALKKLKVKPDLIVSSPYVRSYQTASILAEELHRGKDLKFSDLLIPTAPPEPVLAAIAEEYNVDELMLVGHNPSLIYLLGALIGIQPRDVIGLKKGGVCCLSTADF